MTLAASLLLSALPQVFPGGGDLKLPPKPAAAEQKVEETRPLDELSRFRRDLVEMNGPAVQVEAKLEEMGRAYPKIESLIVQVARTARATEMKNLMPVARRFGRVAGQSRVADELLFQLLARSLGAATGPVVETMAALKGADSKQALQQCVRARIPAVRRHAVDALAPLATADDVPFALALTREQSLDLRLRGVDLLTAVGGEEANARLIELLSKDPAVAAAACAALVRIGAGAVQQLQQHVTGPAVDRSFAYAAFALAQIGDAGGADVLPASLLEPLERQLRAPEALTRCLAAVPLADLVYTTPPADGDDHPDRALVDTLMLVVEPDAFVPNLHMLKGPAEQRLLRHTGRVVAGDENLSWRDWWAVQRETFLGVRARVAVDEQNVGAAIVTLRQQDRTVRVLGEQMADLEPVDGATEVVLTAEQMLTLVQELEASGFGDPGVMRVDDGLPRVRSLQVQVPDGRANAAVTERRHAPFDAMVAALERVVDRELWQLYRIAADEPNRAAFWRAERRWLEANPDETARARRFVQRVLRGWPRWRDEQRVRALAYVAAHPLRKELVREQDGELAVAKLRELPKLSPFDLQLLELAATAPGDRVWRECVQVAVQAEGGGREAVRRVFHVLGPDAVLSALDDGDAVVRRAAVDEVVLVRDRRAAPRLVELLGDEDFDVRRAAAFACGHLEVGESSRPLVELIAAEETDPVLRRECLRALGRVGGELAFPVLQRAMTAPSEEDKEAALRGLGELRDPRAAYLLAELVVVGAGKDVGELARFHLQRQGALLAVPALRAQLPLVRDEEIRAQLVLLLGAWQDPENVPDLMDLLRQPRYAADAATLLTGATGVDLDNAPDRVAAIEQWWRDNKSGAQWQWLLSALAEAGVTTSLREEHFAAGTDLAPVAELARLMVAVEQPRLWVLCSAVLRRVAGQDYGAVTQQTPKDVREGIAGRYRVLAETARAAQKR